MSPFSSSDSINLLSSLSEGRCFRIEDGRKEKKIHFNF